MISEIAQEAVDSLKGEPDYVAVHVPGGIGVEPILYLFGPSAVGLATASIPISKKL